MLALPTVWIVNRVYGFRQLGLIVLAGQRFSPQAVSGLVDYDRPQPPTETPFSVVIKSRQPLDQQGENVLDCVGIVGRPNACLTDPME
jgi:hypothetical protein